MSQLLDFFICWAFRFNFIVQFASHLLHTISGDTFMIDHRSDVLKKPNCDSLRLLIRPKVVLSKISSHFKGSHKE